MTPQQMIDVVKNDYSEWIEMLDEKNGWEFIARTLASKLIMEEINSSFYKKLYEVENKRTWRTINS